MFFGYVPIARPKALREREALWYGYRRVTERGMLTVADIINLESIIEENDAGGPCKEPKYHRASREISGFLLPARDGRGDFP